jgi:hypothetical protein
VWEVKFILIALVLIGTLTASCYFDTSLSRQVCVNETVLAYTIPACSYEVTNLTPLIHRQNTINGLFKILKGTKALPNNTNMAEIQAFYNSLANQGEQTLPQIPPDLLVNATPAQIPAQSNGTGTKNITTVGKCKNDQNRDWLAYCQNNLVGFDCFCSGCEKNPTIFAAWKATKDGIIAKIAEVQRCVYG